MILKALDKLAAAAILFAAVLVAPGAMQAQAAGDTVLKPADMEKLIPASVYYRGQAATTQARNSGGVKFADGYFVLAYLVDTSGYSTEIATKYQAYFITEVAIKVEGKALSAGVYGIGFMGGKFIVTDVGGHDVLTVAAGNDSGLKRPLPLQIAVGSAGGFRLYAGRKFVSFAR
jgi:hypothetical protein